MNTEIKIAIPRDSSGMVGRECLECKKYFKLKPGTGLPTSYCHCPYCDYEGDGNTFFTPDQVNYAKSIAMKEGYEQFIEPALNKLSDVFKELERSTKGGLIEFKVTQSRSKPDFQIKTYNEKILETYVTCDNCHLEFAIYGVFANCPDCNKINAFTIFKKSIEVTQKLLKMANTSIDEIKEEQFKSVLSNSISAFDGLGKALKTKFPALFPDRPKNLFQNLIELDNILSKEFGFKISSNKAKFEFLVKMFQVRHIYTHNFGVIDKDCIAKVDSLKNLEGRKYKLEQNELAEFLITLLTLVEEIQNNLPN